MRTKRPAALIWLAGELTEISRNALTGLYVTSVSESNYRRPEDPRVTNL